MIPYIIALTLFLASAVGAAQEVPSNLQAAIFYKVLAYDYNLTKQSGNDITIVVVTDNKSAGQQDTISAGFQNISGQKLGSKTIKIVPISVSNPGKLESQVTSAGGNIIYIAEGSADDVVSKVIQLAEKKQLSTLCGSERLTEKGIAIGLTVEGGKPKIVINLPASQRQGMKLSSKVLRLAKVLK